MNCKSWLIVIALFATFLIAGFISVNYRMDQNVITDNTYLLTNKELVQGNGLLVHQVQILAQGKRTISVIEPDGQSQIVCDVNEQTGMMDATLMIVSDMFSFPNEGKTYFTYLTQLKGNGVTAGGPSRQMFPNEVELSDILVIDIPDGLQPIGQQLEIGTINGDSMFLVVE